MNWGPTGGWSYIWDHEQHPDLPYPEVHLDDLPADAPPVDVARRLVQVMDHHDDVARRPQPDSGHPERG
ncbi:hypothetical protein Kpho02_77520 [Kitasatospora phosalacinea]|uniref:Uncharacterized protein n=1 Tax=Kitasatospora phosalacinea TaxID=2065 RepID=A0A9W6V7P2_9ACTN|nr:hypothetical protein [Kitasatospora phosalacinea]GLW75455.1 hypothetical protein Kpho02_77520 [Kitasatospora phosalacinea]